MIPDCQGGLPLKIIFYEPEGPPPNHTLKCGGSAKDIKLKVCNQV
jgi:hypothetical protein